MDIYFHNPTGFLSHFIESMVFYEHYDATHKAEKMLPDGFHDLIIDLTERPKHIFDNITLESKQECKQSWFSGARKKLLTIDAGGLQSTMMVIRFKHGAAFHFAQFPVNEITDLVLDTDLAFGQLINELRVRILESEGYMNKFLVAEDLLLKRIIKSEIPEVISYSVNLLRANPTGLSIKCISDKMGYSQKHFIHLFKKHVGMTPKAFQKIQRFQKVILELENTNEINWSRLSLDCGYFDQAHFINDFQQFSGMNPERYMKEKGPIMNYIEVR